MPCEEYKDECPEGLGVAEKPDCTLNIARDTYRSGWMKEKQAPRDQTQ